MNLSYENLSKNDRQHHLVLGVIVISALLLRIVQIDREPLWTDEALTLIIKNSPIFDLFFKPIDPTGGLYYFLSKIVPDGASGTVARLPSVVFGTGSVAAMYWLARAALTSRLSLVAAAMVAVCPALVDFSQEARSYSLLIFMVILSTGALLHWAKEGRSWQLALFGGTSVLALYTHFTAAFWIGPALLIGLDVADRLNKRRAYLIAVASMAAASSPELLRTYNHAVYIGTLAFVEVPSARDGLSIIGNTLTPFGTTGIIALIVYLCLRWKKVASMQHHAMAVALVLASIPLIVWLFSHLVTPIFMSRTVLLGIPGILLLLLIVERKDDWPLGSTVFVLGSVAFLLIHGTTREKEPWHKIAADLRSNLRAGDGILICPGFSAPALIHALNGTAHPVFLTLNKEIASLDSRVGWERRYLLLNRWRLEGRPRSTRMLTPARIWIVEQGCEQKSVVRDWLGGEPASKLFVSQPTYRLVVRPN